MPKICERIGNLKVDINLLAQKLEEQIPKENIYINEKMSKHTTFKIGGNADIFIKAETTNQVQYILNIVKEKDIPLTILGNGSNVLIKDEGIRGIVLKINIEDCSILKQKDCAYVIVGAGMLNAKFAQILLKEELTGFEFASGIPGTIGGAIRMNAGAYGKEICELVEQTTYIDLKDNKIKTLSNKEQKFSYRHSIFMEQKCIITNVKLKLEYGNKEQIAKIMQENLFLRKAKQPIEYPSAGSTFKKGNDFITSKIIDECGLKGLSIGGAQVSNKHAGFIINTGNATANDVIELIKLVEKTVLEKTGKKIELEIEII